MGGGVIEVEGQKRAIVPDIYKLNHMQDIKDYCKEMIKICLTMLWKQKAKI